MVKRLCDESEGGIRGRRQEERFFFFLKVGIEGNELKGEKQMFRLSCYMGTEPAVRGMTDSEYKTVQDIKYDEIFSASGHFSKFSSYGKHGIT